MIASFRHRGLKALYEGRTSRRVAPAHVGMLRRDILADLRLHELNGDMKGHYAVSVVSGNWRATFRFEDGTAVDVDHMDYH